MKKCPECNISGDETTFCSKCGKDLSAVALDAATEIYGAEAPEVPGGYALKSSLNFKKGKYALWANIAGLILFIGATVAFFFIFDLDDALQVCLYVLLGLLLAVGGIVITELLSLLFFKFFGGGKARFHFGVILGAYCKNPLRRNQYVIALICSGLIPIAVFAVLAVFFWTVFIYIPIVFLTVNLLSGCLPVCVYLLKSDKDSLVHFYNGKLNIFSDK